MNLGLIPGLGKISSSRWRIVFAIGLFSVATLSLTPGGVATPSFPQSDKLAHFVAYAALGLTGRLSFRTRMAILVIALMSYGALIEYLQSYLPMREMDFWDFVANTGGVFFGVFLATKVRSRAERDG